MGPLITKEHRDRVASLVAKGVEEGAEVLTDGRELIVPDHEEGFFLGATLLDNVTIDIEQDIPVLGICLRNLPVLAVFAVEVAADSRYRKNTAARQKMKERLLLDRVDMDGAGISVHDGSKHAVDINSHPAFAALAGLNQAQLRT